ncbi:MAG: M48 family metalloprotease [Deltaproteobacteria bacterium]|jgi:Zn-dependent protease with chaperone function|nr:M48 family metalloprotease [Deltaproteobacteria bacterium]
MDEIDPTNFFQWQKDSRQWSNFFIVVFLVVSLAWLGILYLGLNYFTKKITENAPPRYGRLASAKRAELLPGFIHLPYEKKIFGPKLALLAFIIFTIGCSVRRALIIKRNGSSYFTTALGGIPLGETESVLGTPAGEARERVLRHVVAEMSLAAGLPSPDIYILPLEKGINAMAVGLGPDDAAIMITRGALKYLSREELSGLIGHELSHIINGDMRHNTLMAGWLDGFFSLTAMGVFVIRAGGPRNLLLIPVGLFLLALGYLGEIAGKIIQAAFNRRRESMADAYSVQFTRDPACLAGVLKKIGGSDEGSYIQEKKKLELDCRHLFIAESDVSFFATHPPLAHRVWALEPNWDGYWADFEKNPVDYLQEDQLPTPTLEPEKKIPWWRKIFKFNWPS